MLLNITLLSLYLLLFWNEMFYAINITFYSPGLYTLNYDIRHKNKSRNNDKNMTNERFTLFCRYLERSWWAQVTNILLALRQERFN